MRFQITYGVSKKSNAAFTYAVFSNGRNVAQDTRKSLRGALARAKRHAERIAAEHAFFKTNEVTVEMCSWSLTNEGQ